MENRRVTASYQELLKTSQSLHYRTHSFFCSQQQWQLIGEMLHFFFYSQQQRLMIIGEMLKSWGQKLLSKEFLLKTHILGVVSFLFFVKPSTLFFAYQCLVLQFLLWRFLCKKFIDNIQQLGLQCTSKSSKTDLILAYQKAQRPRSKSSKTDVIFATAYRKAWRPRSLQLHIEKPEDRDPCNCTSKNLKTKILSSFISTQT